MTLTSPGPRQRRNVDGLLVGIDVGLSGERAEDGSRAEVGPRPGGSDVGVHPPPGTIFGAAA